MSGAALSSLQSVAVSKQEAGNNIINHQRGAAPSGHATSSLPGYYEAGKCCINPQLHYQERNVIIGSSLHLMEQGQCDQSYYTLHWHEIQTDPAQPE